MSSGLKLDRADTAYAKGYSIITEEQKLVEAWQKICGKIDEMLFDGATTEQLARERKQRATVYVHLTHLRKVHKLAIIKKDGVFKYDGGCR